MATKRVRRVKPPTKIDVSYQKLNVIVGKCEELGYYEADLHQIKLQANQKWHEEANTLLHELLHAIWWCYNLGDDDEQEEKIVKSLSNGLMELFARNPDVLTYFSKVWAAAQSTGPDQDKPAKRKA